MCDLGQCKKVIFCNFNFEKVERVTAVPLVDIDSNNELESGESNLISRASTSPTEGSFETTTSSDLRQTKDVELAHRKQASQTDVQSSTALRSFTGQCQAT